MKLGDYISSKMNQSMKERVEYKLLNEVIQARNKVVRPDEIL